MLKYIPTLSSVMLALTLLVIAFLLPFTIAKELTAQPTTNYSQVHTYHWSTGEVK